MHGYSRAVYIYRLSNGPKLVGIYCSSYPTNWLGSLAYCKVQTCQPQVLLCTAGGCAYVSLTNVNKNHYKGYVCKHHITEITIWPFVSGWKMIIHIDSFENSWHESNHQAQLGLRAYNSACFELKLQSALFFFLNDIFNLTECTTQHKVDKNAKQRCNFWAYSGKQTAVRLLTVNFPGQQVLWHLIIICRSHWLHILFQRRWDFWWSKQGDYFSMALSIHR